MATQTTYIDANGDKRTGYIINGTTYSDAAGTTPVGVGSIVDTAGGRYIKTDNGSQLYADYLKNNGITETGTMNADTGALGTGYIKDGRTYSDPLLKQSIGTGTVVNTAGGNYIKTDNGSMLYADYLKQQESQQKQSDSMKRLEAQLDNINALYEQAVASQNQQLQAQLAAQRANVQEQITSLNRQYDDINKQLYRDYLMNKRDLPETLAAQGITGGLAESSMLKLATGYEGDLAANERARETGIRQINNGMTEAEMQYAIAKAQADQKAAEDAYTREAAIRAAMIEQQNYEEQQRRADEQSAYERDLAVAQLLSKTGDNSKIYELAGVEAPQAVETSPYAPYYQQSARDRFLAGDHSDAVIGQLLNEGYTQRELIEAGYKGNYFGGHNYGSVTVTGNGFQWNGRTFANLQELANAIGSVTLSDAEKNALQRKLATYGYTISF